MLPEQLALFIEAESLISRFFPSKVMIYLCAWYTLDTWVGHWMQYKW